MRDGELVQSSRKKIGFTQRDLADYLGVQQPVISDWEQEGRAIPEGVLKMAKKVQRMSKKTAKAHYILSGKKSQKKPHVAEVIPKCNSLYSLEEKSTPKPPVTDFLGKYPGDSMERYILEAYITFKRSTGHFPTAGDFATRTFKEITRKEALECFGSLSSAKKLAGELMRCQRRGYRKKEPAHNLTPINPRRNTQTAITYLDPNDKHNWLKALYPERDFSKYESKIKVKEKTFTWEELFKCRPESERLVPQVAVDGG